MSTEISKELVAVCMMGGVVVWVEKDRADKLQLLFSKPRSEWPLFIDIDGQQVNPSRVEGIFTASAMEDAQRRKNGQWQCLQGQWHDRFEKCACIGEDEERKMAEDSVAFYKREGHWALRLPGFTHCVRILGEARVKEMLQ